MYLWRGRQPYEVTSQISPEKDEPILLSGADCLKLGLTKWLGSVETSKKNNQKNPIPKTHQKNTIVITSLEQLKETYPDLIDESTIGTFPAEKYYINVDPTIEPKRTGTIPVPVHQQAQFKEELNKMLRLGVIKPIHEATLWISSFVIIETGKDTNNKTGAGDPYPKMKMRVCLDPSNLNKANTREPYYYRTIEDVIPELNTAKYFTIIDMKCGCWQVALDKASSLPTTFNTPHGRFCFTRMPFGLNVAGDAFQQKLDKAF